MYEPAGKRIKWVIFLLCITGFTGMANASTDLAILPSSQTVTPAEEFTLEIITEPDTAVSSIHFDLNYDPAIVEISSITDNDFFTGNDTAAMFNPGTIDNSNGTVSGIYAYIIRGNGTGKQGSFCTVKLLADENIGSCTLEIANLEVTGKDGNKIPSAGTGSVITVRQKLFASTTDLSQDTFTGLNPSSFTRTGSIGWIVFSITATAFFALAYYLDRKK